jgi:hypothetical protein
VSCDIFIRSYSGDFNWLDYCLKSCNKYASGFRSIHIAVPVNDIGLLKSEKEIVHAVNMWADDYLGQQSDKLYADTFCSAEFICHLDSDCIWIQDVSPKILMPNGKPIMLFEEHGSDSPWPPLMQKALGWYEKYDFMRRHPFVFPKHLYSEFRKWFKAKHGEDLVDWIKLQPYHEFTEFNTFGAWCYKFYPECFDIRSPDQFDTFLKQYWSWGGIDGFTGEIDQLINSPQ